MGSTPSRRRAFTLVELLVVVGIITVLIAVLMPALSRAREHANRVKCAANLRSIGQAMTAYVQQSGYYPACILTDTTKPGFHFSLWTVRLRPLMGGNQSAFHCPSRDERFEWVKGAAPPGDKGARADVLHTHFGYELGEPMLDLEGPGMYFSYGYNMWGARSTHPVGLGLGYSVTLFRGALLEAGELRSSRVRSASEMIAVADSNGDGLWDFAIHPDIGYSFAHPGRVHRGGANVLFCDGHVQWYPQKDLVISESDINWERAAKARRWNNDHQGMPPSHP